MNLSQLLSEQFKATYNEKNWLAPLQAVIQGMSAKEAAWKPDEESHSVWQIIVHIAYWNKRSLHRFKGLQLEKIQEDNNETFRYDETNVTDAAWQKTIDDFNSLMTDMAGTIAGASEEKLLSLVSKKYPSPWYSLFLNTNIHNAYHAGQIVTLRKIQQSWSTEKYGVV